MLVKMRAPIANVTNPGTATMNERITTAVHRNAADGSALQQLALLRQVQVACLLNPHW